MRSSATKPSRVSSPLLSPQPLPRLSVSLTLQFSGISYLQGICH